MTDPDELARLRERVAVLEEDKARLDFLDECSARLNGHYGTSYGWTLILNHNVNRLMLDGLLVDLNDMEASKAKLPSCRAAIDTKRNELARKALENRHE